MTRLEWCRDVAPKVYSELTDIELLKKMELYLKEAENNGIVFDDDQTINTGYNLHPGMSQVEVLDYIFSVLSVELNDDIVYKGGYVLSSMYPDEARLTRDIDLDIFKNTEQDKVFNVLQKIGDDLQNAGVLVEYVKRREIESLRSGGYVYYLSKGEKEVRVGIDLGWVPDPELVIRRTIKGVNVKGLDIHCHLADKLTTQVAVSRPRRIKDLYDIFLLLMYNDFYSDRLIELFSEDTINNINSWPPDERGMRRYRLAFERNQFLNTVSNKRIKDVMSFDRLFGVLNGTVLTIQKALKGRRFNWQCASHNWEVIS